MTCCSNHTTSRPAQHVTNTAVNHFSTTNHSLTHTDSLSTPAYKPSQARSRARPNQQAFRLKRVLTDLQQSEAAVNNQRRRQRMTDDLLRIHVLHSYQYFKYGLSGSHPSQNTVAWSSQNKHQSAEVPVGGRSTGDGRRQRNFYAKHMDQKCFFLGGGQMRSGPLN